MKWWWALLLLAPALAAADNIQLCDNTGYYCRINANANCCGPTLTDAFSGANLATDATDGSVTTSKSGGTLYGCIHAQGSVPTVAQLIAGTSPCVVGKTKSSPTAGAVAFNADGSNRFTGLSGSTEYAASYVHVDGTHRPVWQVRTTAPFTTPAGGGAGGSDLTGLVYVVKYSTGSDSNSGVSPAAAWKTLDKINNAVTTKGADVCLMTGEVWEDQQLRPDWGGDASDLGRIGGCYEYAGALYWLNEGPEAGQHPAPEINGTWEPSCLATNPITCELDTASAVPSNAAAGLVDFGTGTSYMQLTDVYLDEAAGRAIDGKGTHHLVFQRIDIGRAAFNSWIMEDSSHHNVVAGLTATLGANCEYYEDLGRLPSGFAHQNCGTSAQPSCIKVSNSDNSYTLLQGVQIEECSGEGFGLGKSSYVWVDQAVSLRTGVSIYGDHSNQIIITRSIMGGEGPTGGNPNQSGQAFALEPSQVGKPPQGGGNNFVVANIALGTEYGFGLRNMNSAAQTAGLKQWGLFHYNTAIGQTIAGMAILGSGAGATDAQNDFTGNIVSEPSGVACDARTSNGTWDYNVWPASGAGDADCVGANDVSATLTWPHTTAQYEAITMAQATGDWDASDFTPTGGSSAHLGVVTPPSVPAWASTIADSAEWDFARNYVDGFGIPGAAGCDGTLSSAQLAMDFTCQTISGGSSDAGAVQTPAF